MSVREGPRSRSASRKVSPGSSVRSESRSLIRRGRTPSPPRRPAKYISRSPSPPPRYRKRHSYSRSRSRSYTPSDRKSYERRKSYSRSPMSQRRRHAGTFVEQPQESRCLGVFGLCVYTTEQKIFQIFTKFGPIERVQVVIDAKTGSSRGFCFVYFVNIQDAKVAKDQCCGMEIDGRRIRVDYSITARAHTPTPGIYRGKSTRHYQNREHNYRSREDDDYKERHRSRHSPSPYYRERRRRYVRTRSRSYSPRDRRYR